MRCSGRRNCAGAGIHLALEWTLEGQTHVVGLLVGHDAQVRVDVLKVQLGDLLIEDLGQDIDADVELARGAELDVLVAEGLVLGLVQHDLRQDLVGEGAGHDERGVAGRATEVDQAAFGEQDDVAPAVHEVAIDLGLDVLDALGIGLEPSNVDLNVKVANVYERSV